MGMTVEQCRAARALLGWSANDLADKSGIGVATVRRFEAGQVVQLNMIGAMEQTLDYSGIAFIATDDASKSGGPGVRLKRDPA